MLNKSHLEAMSHMDITCINRDSLKEITIVAINSSLDNNQKIEAFINMIENPYCFLCDGTPVRVRFMPDTNSLAQYLRDYFISLK